MRKLLLAVTLAFPFSAAFAQQVGIDFDPAKTEIHWSLPGNVHTTHGTFRLSHGHIAVNPLNGAISGELVADAASGDSHNGARDKRMNKEILESDNFKEFLFKPEKLDGSISLTGHSTFRVSGSFVIHGSTHNATIPMDVTFSGTTVSGSGKFSIPYVDWGLKDPSNFLFKVDKTVEVEISAVGSLTAK